MPAVNNVLVVGSGLAGAATAVHLASAGVAVDLVEIKPEVTALGSGITLQGKVAGNRSVNECIAVEAVLLPHEPASKAFGGYVADNYAVVKTTVSNHCSDRQFILHDIFFDYHDWALSGVYEGLTPTTAPRATTASRRRFDRHRGRRDDGGGSVRGGAT